MPNTNHIRRILGTLSVLALLAGGFIGQVPHLYASSWDRTVLISTESFKIIDDLDGTSDVYIQFGDSLNKRIKYDRTKTAFVFDDDVEVIGVLSGIHLHAQDLLTSSGQVIAEGAVQLNSTLDVEGITNFGASTIITAANSPTPGAGQLSVRYDSSNAGSFHTDSSGNMFVETYDGVDTWNQVLRFGQNANVNILNGLYIGNISTAPETALEVAGTMSGTSLTVSSLKNCDTIDTDANGVLSCGTDETGGSSGFTGTGSLQSFFDNRYVAVQGDTMTGGLLIDVGTGNESNTIDSGLALEVVGTASGEHLHFGRLLTGSGTVRIQNISDSTTSFQVLDADGGNPVFNIDTTNERVGIGTDSPTVHVQIGDGAAALFNSIADKTVQLTTTADGQELAYTLYSNDGVQDDRAKFFLDDANQTYGFDSAATAGKPDFIIKSNNNELLRVEDVSEGGNVGIGISSPEAKLDVLGTMSGSSLTISSLKNCDTIDTDANGVLSCGTDETGGSSGFTGTGSLQSFFDNRYVAVQGDTMTGGLLIDVGTGNESNTIDSGLALEVVGTASGEHLHFGRMLTGSGTVRIQNVTDSTTSFQVLDADGGNPVLNIDTTNERVGVGIADPAATLEVDGDILLTETAAGAGSRTISIQGNSGNGGDNLNIIAGSGIGSGQPGGDLNLRGGDASGLTEIGGDVYIYGGAGSGAADGNIFIGHTGSTSRGNVGIGTNSPEATLDVLGTVSGSTIRSFGLTDCDNATNSKLLWDATTGQFSCGTDQTGGSSGFTGTGSLQAFFDNRYVETAGDTMTGALVISPETDTTAMFKVNDADGGTSVFNVDSTNERVGIGNDAPSYPLDVTGDTRITTSLYLGDKIFRTGDTDTYIDFDNDEIFIHGGGVRFMALTESAISQDAVTGNPNNADLDFVWDGDTNESLFRIDAANEYIGVGTATPESKLEVIGSMSGTSLTVSSLKSCDTIDTDANGVLSCGTDDGGSGGISQTDGDARYVQVQGDTMTGGLLIDVGVGNESNAIDSGLALEVVGTASGEHLHFGRLLTGSGTVRIQNVTDSVTSFQVLDADGGTSVFNIDTTNERVGIGNDAPSYPLDVTGDTRVTGDIYVGSSVRHDGDTNTYFQFSTDQIDIVAGSLAFLRVDEDTENVLLGSANNDDIDFAWNGNTNNNIFRIDAFNERVGIATGTPETELEVVGTASGAALYGYDINNSKAATTGSLLISRTANAPEWTQPTSAMMWYIDGDIATGTKQGATVVMPYGFTVTDVDMRIDTAPTGSSLIVDINEGGTTIFSTRPEIDASATSEDGNHVISDTTLAAGSAITLDVDQIGSSTAGTDLTVILKGRRHY